MGQKVHPKSVRLGIIQDWDNMWIAPAKDYPALVREDYDIERYLKRRLKSASLSKVEIARKAQRMTIKLITGRPGMVVGRGGQGLDTLRKELQKLTSRKDIQLDVYEVDRVDADANLIAENIAQQLERRIPYRRALKQTIQRAMRSGVQGIKIMVSGRLGGVEIARTEWSKEGRIPLHTFRADIEYGFTEAMTVFGIIGVKVWIFKGEVMPGERAIANIKPKGGPGGDGGGFGGPDGDGGRGRRGGERSRRGGPRRRAGAVKVSQVNPDELNS